MASQNGSTGIHEEAPVTSGGRKWTIPMFLGIIAILIAVFGISALGADKAVEGEKSLAVLKFYYPGVDPAQSYMAEILSDEVVSSISGPPPTRFQGTPRT